MSVEITIPKLGMTMKEATIARWEKASGEWVQKGDVVLVIETEKITYEIEAPEAGYLQILEPQGAVLPVGARVGILRKQRVPAQAEAAEAPVAPATPPAAEAGLPQARATAPAAQRIKASPLARRIAAEHGLELARIQGTGPGGRIVREDVIRFLEAQAPSQVAPEAPPIPMVEGRRVRRSIPVTGMRRRILEHMHRSLQETAQMTLTRQVDATLLVRLRESLLKRHQAQGTRISYNAILVKMAAMVLLEQPWINASLVENQVLHWEDIHIGVAMELDEGLIVPVVRNPQALSILEIENTLQDLFQKAKSRKLLPDEIQGGTFTVTNLGHLGIDAFTPILNRPESAILGVGSLRLEPVAVQEGQEVKLDFRHLMVLSLTVDHRIIDGAPAARFLRRMAELIEDPFLLVG